MRLSARPLINYNNVNSFDYANQWMIRAGEPNTLYFQLVDLDHVEGTVALRYVAGVGSPNQPASMAVLFPSIDDMMKIQATATQDPNDGSIWSVSLSSTQVPKSGNVIFQLVQGAVTRNFPVLNMMNVEYPNAGCDGSISDSNTFTFEPDFGG